MPRPLKPGELRAAYSLLFSGEHADAVMADLRAEFYDRPITGDTETSMAYKAGAHGVVLHILDMLRRDEQ